MNKFMRNAARKLFPGFLERFLENKKKRNAVFIIWSLREAPIFFCLKEPFAKFRATSGRLWLARKRSNREIFISRKIIVPQLMIMIFIILIVLTSSRWTRVFYFSKDKVARKLETLLQSSWTMAWIIVLSRSIFRRQFAATWHFALSKIPSKDELQQVAPLFAQKHRIIALINCRRNNLEKVSKQKSSAVKFEKTESFRSNRYADSSAFRKISDALESL